MIAAEQEPAVKEQYTMACGMARRGNDPEFRGKRDRVGAVDHPLGAGLSNQFEAMDKALGMEARGPFGSIRDIVAMRQKNMADTTPCLEFARKALYIAR